jgi:alkanesulfonate monooxygenase SsuD/methylene tetrahydromethanopterin reductase-like flavin-dependent oxidoreductase (luciferase family)
MKLDLFYEIDVPRPWAGAFPQNQRHAEQEAYKEALEQIRFADTLGFNTCWLVEHHFREGRSHCPTPEAVHGALSQITENLRLGFGVTLAPFGFTHPARIAEKVATVDVLSGGRVEWGVGRSTPMEQLAFGVDGATSKQQMTEAIRVVTKMWRDEYVEFKGEYAGFEMPRRMVTPKPFQDPHPPAWMAAVSEESSRMAGHLGLGLLSFSIMQPIKQMGKLIAAYREEQANQEPVADTINNRAACYTLVHCVEDESQLEPNKAWESVWWWYKNIAEFTLEWELSHMPQEQQDKLFPLLKRFENDEIDPRTFNDADMIMVGTPETVIEKMRKYADLGVDQLLCYVQFGQLPHESVMKTLELLGKEVIPTIADYTGERVEVSITAK